MGHDRALYGLRVLRALSSALQSGVQSLISSWPSDQALRVLLVGANGGLAAAIDAALDPTYMALTVTDATSSAVGRGERLWQGSSYGTAGIISASPLLIMRRAVPIPV